MMEKGTGVRTLAKGAEHLQLASCLTAAIAALPILASTFEVSAAETRVADGKRVSVERIASKLDVPWAIDFLPGCEFVVTERGGKLLHFDRDGNWTEVEGVPRVISRGQGGLLDVVAAQDFPDSRTLFFSYSKRLEGGGSGTAVARAKLSENGKNLQDLAVIFEATHVGRGGSHYGSSIVEARNGDLFVTLGERGEPELSQDLSNHNGTIVRISRDGSVPDGNPFAESPGALAEIWSYGHRNPQGAALDAEGTLWAVEHGARGGDEINRIGMGLNYGWPVISYGVHYSGRKIGEGVAKDGMEQPKFYWDPSIAPSAIMVYSGKLWPEWEGHFFVGSLKFDYISRLDPEGGLREVEQMDFPETKRIRDVREAPDGSIWFLSEDRGAAYRMVPEGVDDPLPECEPRSL